MSSAIRFLTNTGNEFYTWINFIRIILSVNLSKRQWAVIRLCTCTLGPCVRNFTVKTEWKADKENNLSLSLSAFKQFWEQFMCWQQNQMWNCTSAYKYCRPNSTCPLLMTKLLILKLLKPNGHVMHQQFNIQQLYVLPTLYLCVLYLSENKQWLVPLIS
jgi:hypothetical protein